MPYHDDDDHVMPERMLLGLPERTNQEFSSVDIIPPWFSILTCHPENEQ
jgi:hypothetical protein